jgi:hypothetical protein
MSFQITTAFVTQWGNTITLLSQQKGSKLRGAVTTAPGVNGESWTTEQLGAMDFDELTGRHQDTKISDATHARRWGYTKPFSRAELIDKQDRVRTLVDPTNSYTQAMIYGAGRVIDDVIIGAMDATVPTGKAAATSTAFPTANIIYKDGTLAGNGNDSGTALPLTVAKVLRARTLLLNSDVPGDDGELYFGCHPTSLMNLLYTTKVGSADYNSVRALQDGTLRQWLGFNWIISTRFRIRTGTVRRNFAFHRMGIECGFAEEPMFRMDVRPDKNYATQVYARLDVGAVRKEEAMVIAVEADEATISDT